MSAVIEKHVQLTNDRAKRLELLATTRGITEDAVIEEALDMLFRDKGLNENLLEDWEWLSQYEAENGPLPYRGTGTPIDPKTIVEVIASPIRARRIYGPGESS